MKSIKKEELDYITNLDPALKRLVHIKYNQFFSFKIESFEALSSLIVRYHNDWDILTPKQFVFLTKTWTTGKICSRLIEQTITLNELSQGNHLSKRHDANWFKRFHKLTNQFDYKKLDPLFLTFPNNQERKENTTSSFKILDGHHRSIFLTYEIMTNKLKFQPIEAILFI